jgi:hypothetical protein
MVNSLGDLIDDFTASLSFHQTTLIDVILVLLRRSFNLSMDHPSNQNEKNMQAILKFLYEYDSGTQKSITEWANQVTMSILVAEMSQLASKDTGFHFQAKKTTESKLKEFNILEMATTMQRVGPVIWKLFGRLLEANPHVNYKRHWARKKVEAAGKARQKSGNIRLDEDIEMEDITQIEAEDNDYWETYDREELLLVNDDEDEPEGLADQLQDQFAKLKTIVSVSFMHTDDMSQLKNFFRSKSYVLV